MRETRNYKRVYSTATTGTSPEPTAAAEKDVPNEATASAQPAQPSDEAGGDGGGGGEDATPSTSTRSDDASDGTSLRGNSFI